MISTRLHHSTLGFALLWSSTVTALRLRADDAVAAATLFRHLTRDFRAARLPVECAT
ncbi:MAG: hypothetical protein JOZ36_15130 [Acidobacteria bacterium]|nr:hypothetical protein [Acidobacteriota bacterium]